MEINKIGYPIPKTMDLKLGLVRTQLNMDLKDFRPKMLNIIAIIAGINMMSANILKPNLGSKKIKKEKIHVDIRTINI